MLDVIYCDQIFRSESALAALQLPTHFGWVSYSTKEDSDKKTHQNHTWSQLTRRTVGFGYAVHTHNSKVDSREESFISRQLFLNCIYVPT